MEAELTGEKLKLSVVKKDNEKSPAKILPVKRIEYKRQLLLPPPQANYIKVKKHDFL